MWRSVLLMISGRLKGLCHVYGTRVLSCISMGLLLDCVAHLFAPSLFSTHIVAAAEISSTHI